MTRFARMRFLLLPLLLLAGCAPQPPATITRTWIAGATEPAFDPDGPPQALRWSLERLLSRGLVERDSSGHVVPAAAESVGVSPDGRTWTFRLRAGLAYTDGTPVTSADFRDALVAGLPREDHATRAWLLAAVRGVGAVRAGRPLPPLGIETPDPRTLVLRLAAPDTLLPDKLALPGVATPWKVRAGVDWVKAVGLGPFRVVRAEGARGLVLVGVGARAGAVPLADTLRVRFLVGAPRVREALRRGEPDVVWPPPPDLLSLAPPDAYRLVTAPAAPGRRLLLVLRADVPPTTKDAARRALAHATNRAELVQALTPRGKEVDAWFAGAGPFDFPSFDASETRAWMERGRLGASIHVVLAYDADGAGAEVARQLQGQWARQGFYAGLRPLRGADVPAERLRAAAAQAQLVEAQALVPGPVGELAGLVMPIRGPAVGGFRTGWRTREFDAWLLPGRAPGPLDPADVQARLAEELVALPLAELPWQWVERSGQRVVRPSPRFGPEFAATGAAPPVPRGSR